MCQLNGPGSILAVPFKSAIKTQWTRELLDTFKIDYLCFQEHFKKNVGNFFPSNFPGYSAFVVPATRAENQDSGRPKGGLAQLNSTRFQTKVKRISTSSPRLQAQILEFPNISLLWINTYFPTDPQTQMFDDTELRDVLRELEEILDTAMYDHVLVCGDLNWHRSRMSGFSVAVHSFVERIGLASVWDKFPVSHTHVHTDNASVSTLDHFLADPVLLQAIVEASAIQLGDNMSRHSPIILKVNIQTLPARKKENTKSIRRPAWYKSCQEERQQFKAQVEEKLSLLHLPHSLTCTNPTCKEPDHTRERDAVLLDMMGCIIEASHATLPMSGGGKPKGDRVKSVQKTIPGWTEFVEPKRQDALFWHAIWVSAGRPNRGELRNVMAHSRNKFHYAVRSVRRQEDTLRARKLLEASKSGSVDLLAEMKKIKGAKKGATCLPDTVAGKTGEDNIVTEFRRVYQELYNLCDDADALAKLKRDLETDIGHQASAWEVSKVTGQVVKEASKRLLGNKGDVTGSYNRDMIKNCPDLFYDMLAAVFRSWLTHGTVTRSFLACAFLPLVKGLKDPSLTDSYRAVAGSSVILKLFDYVILTLWGDLLQSDSLQFGYKKSTSTTECSWLVMTVADHFRRRGSPVHCATLDAKQGFDRCSWEVIFSSLRKRKLPAVVTRALMFVYMEQTAVVRWGKVVSEPFSLTNGTRQGSVISPTLWCVYCEDLIAELRTLGLGCRMFDIFVGVTVYADDVILLAPSRSALQEMLKVTENFAKNHNIVFSTNADPNKSKSKCILFSGKKEEHRYPAPLMLSGKSLPWVKSAVHLGHELRQECNMEHDTWTARAKFIDKSVSVRDMFGFARPAEVLSATVTYCCDFYGSNLWDLYGLRAEQCFRAWTTAVKLAWDMPRTTHTWLVDNLLSCKLASARERVLANYVGFINRLGNSASWEVRILSQTQTRDAGSATGRNIINIRQEFGQDPRGMTPGQMKDLFRYADVPGGEGWKLDLLRDMLWDRQAMLDRGEEGEELALLQSYIEILAET